MLDLSVIIPIYNTPLPTLERCFLSVQQLEDCAYEALLIDDGSAPAVGDFCREYADKHPAFRYIYKENGGVSSARSLGLAQAQGRYLTFLDADDILLPAPLTRFLSSIDTPDMIIFDMLLSQRGRDSVWRGFDRPTGAISRQDLLCQLFTTSSISGPCAKLYLTQRLREEHLAFDPGFISGEDWMFVCDCALHMNSFFYCAEATYQYFREEATGQTRLTRFPDQVLSNQIDRFDRKQQVIASQQWEEYAPENILSLSAAELIEGMFNSAAELLLSKQYTPDRKERIRSAVVKASPLLTGPVSKKTKLKLWVLTRCPIALWFLAKLRAVYLSRK